MAHVQGLSYGCGLVLMRRTCFVKETYHNCCGVPTWQAADMDPLTEHMACTIPQERTRVIFA